MKRGHSVTLGKSGKLIFLAKPEANKNLAKKKITQNIKKVDVYCGDRSVTVSTKRAARWSGNDWFASHPSSLVSGVAWVTS